MPRHRLNQLRTNQPVNVASESTTATLEYAWSHRWLSTFTASYGIAGGRDAESRQMLPRTRTAAVGASLDYKLGRHDQLDSGVGVSHSLVSSGYDNWTVLSETWKHKLNKELTELGGRGDWLVHLEGRHKVFVLVVFFRSLPRASRAPGSSCAVVAMP